MNVKNWLKKEDVMQNLFDILVFVNVNVINHVAYLDYKNCKCRKELISNLVEECNENIAGNEMIYNDNLNDYEIVYNFWTIYIVLFVIVFLTIIGISSAFICFHWYLKKGNIETAIYQTY